MISINNRPLNAEPSDSDFKVENYKKLIQMALLSYHVADYQTIPWGQKFILWRHDCDYSLNRSLAVANIEADAGLKSTFFLNPHCEFYNLLENDQRDLIYEILQLGHDIALHFDAAFYDTENENDLSSQIIIEADILEHFLGVRPTAFSFHNPKAFHLNCEADSYGGLINCYSKRFKTEVGYCSDSNGYWRFRKLGDCLEDAKDPCIQVVTHPGWWQERLLSPRDRIFRCAYGRANSTMRDYDRFLDDEGRVNHDGRATNIRFIEKFNPKLFALLDYLSNTSEQHLLFTELLRVHERQIVNLCQSEICSKWNITNADVNSFFNNPDWYVDALDVWDRVFTQSWQDISSVDETIYRDFKNLSDRFFVSEALVQISEWEEQCTQLSNIIERFCNWGLSQPKKYHGLTKFESKYTSKSLTSKGGLKSYPEVVEKSLSGDQDQRWSSFKNMQKK
jgi:hypothetical protein